MAVENRELKLKLESMKDDPIVMAIFLEESKLRASLRTMDKARSDFLSCDKVFFFLFICFCFIFFCLFVLVYLFFLFVLVHFLF